MFTNQEAVPFRFTPNIQHFITPVGIEGVFTASLMSIARSLSECDLEDYLSIFVRDELISWQSTSKKPAFQPGQIRELVFSNVDLIIRRTQSLGCTAEGEKDHTSVIPCNQTILDLISQAVNPLKLAQMDVSYIPQL